MLFNLADSLFEDRQGLLLYFVSLLQLQKLLFQGFYIGVRCRLQHRGREKSAQTHCGTQ
ncbi:hypothetical protein D3C81_1897360 [compost metagenome]